LQLLSVSPNFYQPRLGSAAKVTWQAPALPRELRLDLEIQTQADRQHFFAHAVIEDSPAALIFIQ
jgi:hypothetical protein